MTKTPKFCQWDITDTCNLHCKMCRNEKEETKTSKEWKLICNSIIKSGVEECILAGGEPLTHPNFQEIVRFLVSSSKKVSILTNGTLIDSDTAEFLSLHKCSIQVSIDGGNEKTHNQIRGDGSFLRTMKGISNLKKKDVKFATKLTLTSLNFQETGEFVRLSKDIGAVSANLRRCIPVGGGRSMQPLKTDSLRMAYKEAFLSGVKCGIKISTGDCFAPLSFSPERKSVIEARLSSTPDTILGGCPIGWTAYYVRWDGVMMFCPYLQIECGNLLKQDFVEIWGKSEMYRVSRNLRWNLTGKCAKCKYLMACGGCPAVAYHTNGNILSSDPQCWL